MAESQVPATVLHAFHEQYPGAAIKACAKETKGSRIFYEIETDGGTSPHTVIYTPDGKVAETEVQIPVSQLPAAVQEAVKLASPTGTIKLAEIAQKRGQTVYEVEIAEGTRVVECVFDASGKLLEKK
jgi:uncharacterized membrane protein YkoI